MTIDAKDSPDQSWICCWLKSAPANRREWLESKGNLAQGLTRWQGMKDQTQF